jgi:hypothetical protein
MKKISNIPLQASRDEKYLNKSRVGKNFLDLLQLFLCFVDRGLVSVDEQRLGLKKYGKL